MKVTIERENLRFVVNLIENVADEYQKVLHNSMIFTAKLIQLEVFVRKSPVEKTVGIAKVIDVNTGKCGISLLVNSDDGEEFISFVVAHEFAHILMINPNDMLKLANRAEDGSTSYTAIKRITSDNNVYGRAFEEAVADKLALYIIGKVYGNQGVERVKKLLNEHELKRLDHIEKFANVFGKPLDECTHIDEFVFHDNSGCISNMFWYKIVTFDFGIIIDAYNSVMNDAEKNFYALDEAFDAFFNTNQQEYEKAINSSLKEFIEKSTEEA